MLYIYVEYEYDEVYGRSLDDEVAVSPSTAGVLLYLAQIYITINMHACFKCIVKVSYSIMHIQRGNSNNFNLAGCGTSITTCKVYEPTHGQRAP